MSDPRDPRWLQPPDLSEIHRQLGELKGDVKGLLAAFSRLAGQIDEHLVADEKAHARQDQRIAELFEAHARSEGGHEATVRWGIVMGAIVGAICGLVGPLVIHALHL